ncbi:MAG: glycoside hydrolase family 2 TIM barrel-domain containing protein, partial [Bariatricus sp.]
MKDMGANAIRTSHNPADEDFIDICNELGLLVIEEAFDGWSVSKNGNSNDFGKYFNSNVGSANLLGSNSNMTWAEYAVKAMVLRDRNDPSVILWSLGNEIQEGASADSSFPTIAQNLIDWIEEEDTTRQTTIGSNQRTTSGTLGSVHSVIYNNGGIVGFNYASASQLDSLAESYGGVIIASETSSAVNSRGIYTSQESRYNADGKYHLTSYDTSAVSWGMTAHDSLYNTMTRDFVAGEFVWTGFDYLGEPTPWNGTGSGSVSGSGAIPNSSYFGIVETTGFPKDTYYFYRSQWNQSENTLHLVTAWDSDNMLTSNGKTPVVIYSNAPKVELYRNGTLIGTATRTVNTTTAGYQYYTYTTVSNDSSVCTAESGSGSTALYATFNVAYEEGTISAKAYDENGVEITNAAGNAEVSTPGTVSKLNVQVNKESINADGSSLAYISVEVEDEKGNLDTTAVNTIHFSLTGNGEIVGVDNGDQATTSKYQQSSVLTSTTSAKIAAYAGKALVIVRSTKDAGSFTVSASSDGLTGGSVTVTTNQVNSGETEEGLVSYTMVRDYTIKAGTKPTFKTVATGTKADKTEVNGTVEWNEVSEETYNTPGDYVVKGTLSFEGEEPLDVICRLHVIGDVIALRNISTATMVNTVPTLPDQVDGVLADGTLCGEFAVTWDEVSADKFATVDEIVVVNGTAKIFGDETLPVTASVRVTEAVNTESTNVAPAVS